MKNYEKILSADDIHLGRSVKEELKRQGRSATWLAQQVHCTSENIYKIFRQQWVSMPLLFSISVALHHDFFKECSDCLQIDTEAES